MMTSTGLLGAYFVTTTLTLQTMMSKFLANCHAIANKKQSAI